MDGAAEGTAFQEEGKDREDALQVGPSELVTLYRATEDTPQLYMRGRLCGGKCRVFSF